MTERDRTEAVERLIKRRDFIRRAAAGTVLTAFGGGVYYVLSDDLTAKARAQVRDDGRPRLPPGQKVIRRLRPMGGEQGDPSPGAWRLKVHGEVDAPFEIDFRELLAMPQTEAELDVHCVTAWTVLGAPFKGVAITELAERAKVKDSARYVIFEAAHGYTANVPLDEALKSNTMVAHQLEGRPLPRRHGAPVRAVIPDLYFWKSSKWLTGIRFVRRDQPGYWERRGYHNYADPWKEQRHG